jgi:hypothetical protein
MQIRIKIVYVGKTEFSPGMTDFMSMEEVVCFLALYYPSWTKFTMEVRRDDV